MGAAVPTPTGPVKPQVGAASLHCSVRFSAEQAEFFMNGNDTPFWNTASTDHTPDTSPMELSALGEHLDVCKASRGRLFALRRATEALDRFVAGRFVTTLVLVIALLIAMIVVASRFL
jgi:hypothetical protein